MRQNHSSLKVFLPFHLHLTLYLKNDDFILKTLLHILNDSHLCSTNIEHQVLSFHRFIEHLEYCALIVKNGDFLLKKNVAHQLLFLKEKFSSVEKSETKINETSHKDRPDV